MAVYMAASAFFLYFGAASFTALIFLSLGLFTSKTILVFYLIFEIRVLPIFYIILAFGYQTERLQAAFRLFLYTVLASIPFLLAVLYLQLYQGMPSFRVIAISQLLVTTELLS